ncbi:MAG: ABC transporter permease [Micavibrio aeruginosavorus]|uniref:ABC transporter permease n=1 Tax=Micavibrio aeruginosavorus TaxID=349221 RepID=A0A2W4ZSQ1_9BACT|nr:MAG: ABC transporter permease [Micavibrio aeruginosavorus]
MSLFLTIAVKHIMARKRQSFVSLLGIIIGVGFFLAIASLMQGSQNDFISRLIDNSPHITVHDEYRDAKEQPIKRAYKDAFIELRSVQPLPETRGIRGYKLLVEDLKTRPGVRASATLTGQAILNYAGRDNAIVLNGMIPADMKDLTTVEENMKVGSVDDLIANKNGIIVGAELCRRLMLEVGDTITLTASTGQVRTFKIVGIFQTGSLNYDDQQAFTDIKRVQAMMNKSNRANTIIIKMDDVNAARDLATEIEARIGYKTVSWQEASEDILSTLVIRNVIMYTVVSAVLLVAAFGIYNIIFTIIMEKQKDIAILKSMGFRAGDIKTIFIIQGCILGIGGVAFGLPFGCLLMLALEQITFEPPGVAEPIHMPIDWSAPQFIIAGGFAFIAAVLASYLPAKKGANVLPVDILRGGQ